MDKIKEINDNIRLINTFINLYFIGDNVNEYKILKQEKITKLIVDLFILVSGKIKSRLLYELLINSIQFKDNVFVYNGHKQISYDRSYVLFFTKIHIVEKVKNLNIMYMDLSIFSFIIFSDITEFKYKDYSWVDDIIIKNNLNPIHFLKLQKIILTAEGITSSTRTYQIQNIPEDLELKEFIILVYENFLFFLLELVEPPNKKSNLPHIDSLLKGIINKLDK